VTNTGLTLSSISAITDNQHTPSLNERLCNKHYSKDRTLVNTP